MLSERGHPFPRRRTWRVSGTCAGLPEIEDAIPRAPVGGFRARLKGPAALPCPLGQEDVPIRIGAIPSVVVAALLLLALRDDNPLAYYRLLRIVCCTFFGT